jgi:hypothetical protein
MKMNSKPYSPRQRAAIGFILYGVEGRTDDVPTAEPSRSVRRQLLAMAASAHRWAAMDRDVAVGRPADDETF